MRVEGENPIWDNGYNAYCDGFSRDENPYQEDDPRFDDWENGWDMADSYFDDE